MAKVTVDGIQIEAEEKDVQIIERAIAKLTTELATAKTALATAQTTAQNDVATAQTTLANIKGEISTKDAEIATLKQQLGDAKMSPQKLDQMVSARVATVERARSIIGDALVMEGKTDAEMRRQVVNAKLGEVAKDWSDDMINASFNTLSVGVSDTGNGLNHVVQVIRNNESNSGDMVGKAYRTYDTDLSNRWKTAGVRQ